MQEYLPGQQVKIYFQDGSSIIASVQNDDGNNLECIAVSPNEAYQQGDKIFADKNTAKIEKQNFYRKINNNNLENKVTGILDSLGLKNNYRVKNDYEYTGELRILFSIDYMNMHDEKDIENFVTKLRNEGIDAKARDGAISIKPSNLKRSKRFDWEFDRHAPQWKLNKESMEIEKDEDAISKVGRLKKLIKQSHKINVGDYQENLQQVIEFLNKYNETDAPEYLDSCSYLCLYLHKEFQRESDKCKGVKTGSIRAMEPSMNPEMMLKYIDEYEGDIDDAVAMTIGYEPDDYDSRQYDLTEPEQLEDLYFIIKEIIDEQKSREEGEGIYHGRGE